VVFSLMNSQIIKKVKRKEKGKAIPVVGLGGL
jgi:hypothetical protein